MRPMSPARPGLALLPALWLLPQDQHEPFLKAQEQEALKSGSLPHLRAIRDYRKMQQRAPQ